MRSDFKQVFRLFGKLTDDNPLYTSISEEVMHNYCHLTIIGDFEETLEAMKTNGSIVRNIEFTPEENKTEYVYCLTNQGYNELKTIYNIPTEGNSNNNTSIHSSINSAIELITV